MFQRICHNKSMWLVHANKTNRKPTLFSLGKCLLVLFVFLNFVANFNLGVVMSLNEKLRDLNYVDRNEWFGIIKDVCRSQSKRVVGFLVVVLLLLSLAGIYFFTFNFQGNDIGDIATVCFELVICFALIWGIVNNLRFLQVVGSLDTPQQLLLQHEKREKNDRKAALVGMLVVVASLGGPYSFTDWSWGYWAMKAILIALILIFYFKGIYMRSSDRDNEISERLQELINPE